jgi:predicted regulator of Ras-like GTPase activity (Roadblock/LC7/MglB family)
LAEPWPEPVRKEIADLKLGQARVMLPLDFVEREIKTGKLSVRWKDIRSWIKPSPLPTVSARDEVVLELPLKVIAPIFLARIKGSNPARARVAVDENIPNLFFGFPQAEPIVAPAPHPASGDTNYYCREEKAGPVRTDGAEAKGAPTAGTKFVAKYATPNEVVSRAAGLEHVAGALIALPDGLLVASRLDPELSAETIAAFLPQIFAKVSQCTRELRMGELNNLNFTVGNVPWKIFRINAIYFAAVGRSGEPLPSAQLAALAVELDHKAKS